MFVILKTCIAHRTLCHVYATMVWVCVSVILLRVLFAVWFFCLPARNHFSQCNKNVKVTRMYSPIESHSELLLFRSSSNAIPFKEQCTHTYAKTGFRNESNNIVWFNVSIMKLRYVYYLTIAICVRAPMLFLTFRRLFPVNVKGFPLVFEDGKFGRLNSVICSCMDDYSRFLCGFLKVWSSNRRKMNDTTMAKDATDHINWQLCTFNRIQCLTIY